MTATTKPRFALIELNSGFAWWVGHADSAAAACAAAQVETGGDAGAEYSEISRSEIRSTAGGYAVYEAPAGFDVDDGQDETEIAAVEALPLVGYFRQVSDAGND